MEASTSVLQLRHIASGRRKASAAMAQRLVHASRELFHANPLLWLRQTELCEACGKCPLAIRVTRS